MPYVDKIMPNPHCGSKKKWWVVFIAFVVLGIVALVAYVYFSSLQPTLLRVEVTGMEMHAITVMSAEEGNQGATALEKVSSGLWKTRAGADYGPWLLRMEYDDGKEFWITYFAASIEGAIPAVSTREFNLSLDKLGAISINEYETTDEYGRVEVSQDSFDPAGTSKETPFVAGWL